MLTPPSADELAALSDANLDTMLAEFGEQARNLRMQARNFPPDPSAPVFAFLAAFEGEKRRRQG